MSAYGDGINEKVYKELEKTNLFCSGYKEKIYIEGYAFISHGKDKR